MQPNNLFKTILFCILILSLYSCITHRNIYSPAPPNNPYFQKTGDSKLTAYYSGGDGGGSKHINHGYDIQAAYAPLNNWAITASYYNRTESDVYSPIKQPYSSNYNIFDSADVRYNRTLTEFGAGYFIPVSKGSNITFNLYAGFGFGKFNINDKGMLDSAAYTRLYESNIKKWYLQPGINFIVSDYFRLGLIGRISWVHYSGIKTSYTRAEIEYFYLDKIKNSTLSFLEPTLNIQAGFKKINWLKIDGGFTLCTGKGAEYPDVRNFNASIGLSFDLVRLLKSGK